MLGAAFALLVGCRGAAAPSPLSFCEPVPTFADGVQPAAVRHVAVTGDDRSGDGSSEHPFRTMTRAAEGIVPGTAIRLHAGSYDGGNAFADLRGTASAPIWIEGAAGEPRPIIAGGHQAIYLTRVSHIVLRHLEIAHTRDHGINVDDGERVDDPQAAHSIVFDDLMIHDTGERPSGVPDCLKLAGVNDFVVTNSEFSRCGPAGNGAVGVNGVGTHRGRIAGNSFHETGFGAIQFKGASSDIEIAGNELRHTGTRGVNMGGATGGPFFRPPLMTSAPNYEAARIRVSGNVFVGSEAAAAFAGCVDCEFSHNTVVDPEGWVLRILQETVRLNEYTFAAAANGRIANNVFLFERSALNRGEDINVGAGTSSESFALVDNSWYAHDTPEASSPRLPTFRGRATENVEGVRPQFVEDGPNAYRVTASDDRVAPGAPACNRSNAAPAVSRP